MSRSDWSLDVVLQQLREHRLVYEWDQSDLKVWHAVCPVCRAHPGCCTGEWTLRLREPWRGGPISLACTTGCEDTKVRAALAADPDSIKLADALRLAEDARSVAAKALQLLSTAHGPRVESTRLEASA
jgi:hypothetical protein